jgi:hypothetical protein
LFLKVKDQHWRSGALFAGSKCIRNLAVEKFTPLLSLSGLVAAVTPTVIATARGTKNAAHALDFELLGMAFNKGVLHFMLFAKYAAAFFKMANSSA